MERTLVRDLPVLAVVALLYAAGLGCSALFHALPGDVTPVWPPAGVGLAATLLYGRRSALGIGLGILVGHTLFDPVPPLFMVFSITANTLAPLVATECIRHLGPVDVLSVRVRNTLALVLGSCLLGVVSALCGCLGLVAISYTKWSGFGGAWLLWWVGDFFGALLFAPALICTVISFRRYRAGNKRVLQAPMPEVLFWALSFPAFGLLTWLLSRHSPHILALSPLPLALFLWSAFRFAPVYTYLSVALTLLGILIVTALGLKGLPQPGNVGDTAVLMLFFCTMAVLPQLVTAANFERRYFESKLIYRANHDRLTGLRNRNAFEEHTSAVLKEARTSGEPTAMAYLDLDQFKVVNDTCGHMVGDHLIRQISAVAEGELQGGDIVARMGGDEFAVLFRDCTPDEALKRADTLRRHVEEFRFSWKERMFAFTVSIGVLPVDPELGFNKQLSMADTACFQAKEQGRNRIKLVRLGDQDLTRHHDEVEWVVRINEALAKNRFCLYCQPIVPLQHSAEDYRHFEILLRMLDDRGNVLLPGAFVPAAERYHLMSKVDRWVVEHTLQWLAKHPRALQATSMCSINLSGPSLSDDSFHKFLKHLLRTHGVPAEKICLEITETAAIGDLGQANRFIRSMRREGCRFALDDFGSGLASFGYLKTLNVDYLKIDGAFVRDIAQAPVDLAMVKSINEVGHVMGKKTIAEYVESEEIRTKLNELGVDYAQGYAVGRPQSLDTYFAEETTHHHA